MNLLGILYLTLIFGIFSHSFRQEAEIEIAHIRAVSLKVRILLEKAVELVSSDLSFEKNVFGVVIGELFDLVSDRI